MTSRKPNGVVKTVYDNVRKLEKEKNRITEQKAVLDRQDQEVTEKLTVWKTKQKKLEKIFAEVEEMIDLDGKETSVPVLEEDVHG
ncbi:MULTISPECIES: hypothetical protein [Erysipelotrichaceae]|jgi:hypothetical protein|uniref:hypothetical protein n=1 Tax=Erysipelotrichaceae TaxID=128827 RepID=UPI00248FA8A8|nr:MULTISPECIES: hypothetical protein [Erysipelotrichaceae]